RPRPDAHQTNPPPAGPRPAPPAQGRPSMPLPGFTLSQRRLPPRRPRLAAYLGVGEYLVGIRALLGIEDRAQADHGEEIVGREEQRHLGDLLHADAVLAGDAAAERNARLEYLAARRQHPLHLVRVTLVEQQNGMDVAVAGVEAVPDAEPVALAGRGDRSQDVGNPGARHHPVLGAVARRQPADCAEGTLAALPEGRALCLIARDPQLAHAVCPADGVDA